MRRFILWQLFVFFAGGWIYGAAVLKGKITLQNSGGKPVAHAQVSAFGSNPVSSTDSGFFQLAFPGKAPGDVVSLTVQKQGFEVVNKKDLERVILRKSPEEWLLEISMCPARKWQENARLYYGIAAESINKEFAGQLKKIQAAVMSMAEKDREIQKLREKRDAALAQAKKIAEDFAQVDLDDAGRAGFLNNLGVIYSDTGFFAEAEKSLSEALDIRKKLAGTNPAAYLPYVAGTLNNLGNLYYKTTRFSDAEKSYSEALDIRRKLAETNPAAYLPDVAMTLNNLGTLYSDTTRFSDAEKSCSEALDKYRKLAETNPAAYLPDVAMTLNNLGNLYSDTTRFSDAEKSYSEALDKYRKLAETNPAAYLQYVAATLNNLGLLEISNENYTNACTLLKEALKIREKLALANPSAFDLDLCQTILTMIKLYASAPGSCSPGDMDIPALLHRAGNILKKYPDVPLAQNLLKIVENINKIREKAPGNKKT